MSAKLNIFITGATGYVGGSVVARLLKHPKFATFKVTALVRSVEKAEKLKTLGVETILGSYDDLEVLKKAASEADVVFAIADSDNVAAAQAIADGLKKRHADTGKVPTLIHTSGTANIADNALGMHSDHKVYSDLDVEAIEALPPTQLHRTVDLLVLNADKEGYLKSYIITPGTVFGTPSGPLVDLGIQNTHSIQFPYFIRAAIDRKQGGYIGAGKNVWCAADVDETADVYIVLFNAILGNPASAGHGRDGWYFVESCEYTAIDVAKRISEDLVELGVGTNPAPSAFSPEENTKYFGNFWPVLATNSRAKADRARALGWKPVKGTNDLLDTLKAEIEFNLKK
ncbi:hypothetical protein BDQ12DRAFT_711156 [Crucibulum laeve]|uniref:NmrA-like domain-containing protein n=1 Tax=Crucibulum laeve TaxID=68775 RepID=A0A5C3M556_9AGAR|nr:hypothetical protein BDQ12DRAFT_711156 [Crucibulum laeve]